MKISQQHQDFVNRLLSDQDLRARLLSEPARALREQGISVSSGAELRVVENTAEVCHFVLPPNPNASLSDAALSAVSGGTGGPGYEVPLGAVPIGWRRGIFVHPSQMMGPDPSA